MSEIIKTNGVMHPDGDLCRFIGKAGEFLVCFDLTLQGFDVSLASRNHAYDIVADRGDRIVRVQVRTCSKMGNYGKQKNVYRFSTRTGRHGVRRASAAAFDLYAFVALDIRKVAYFSPREMLTSDGHVKQTVDLHSAAFPPVGRSYPNGTVRKVDWGRYIDDFGTVPDHV